MWPSLIQIFTYLCVCVWGGGGGGGLTLDSQGSTAKVHVLLESRTLWFQASVACVC
jgi:hypothetical protein